LSARGPQSWGEFVKRAKEIIGKAKRRDIRFPESGLVESVGRSLEESGKGLPRGKTKLFN
jgi:hypothetical protein